MRALTLPQIYQRLRMERRPLRFLFSRLLRLTQLSQLFTIDRGAYRVRFYPTALSATLWIEPGDRNDDEQFVMRYLRPGEVFVDVGANIGILSLAAASVVGASGQVYAIEAHPRIYEYLVRNVGLNHFSTIHTVHTALGGGVGSAVMSNLYSDDQNFINASGQGDSVPLTRLDALSLPPKISLLKIDVEGYERFVLQGASGVLGRVDAIYLEAFESLYRRYGYGFSEVFDILHDAGFRLYEIVAFGVKEIFGSYRAEECRNVLAVRDPDDLALRMNRT